MKLEDFRDLILSLTKHHFPYKRITLVEKRKIIIEARVEISEEIFIEIYYNILTNKKSFALIKNNERIFGCDNYRYWHLHPWDNPAIHIPCEEPSVEKIFEEVKNYLTILEK